MAFAKVAEVHADGRDAPIDIERAVSGARVSSQGWRLDSATTGLSDPGEPLGSGEVPKEDVDIDELPWQIVSIMSVSKMAELQEQKDRFDRQAREARENAGGPG